MTKINLPTKDVNPTGLHKRYTVTKLYGEPSHPDDFYFVLCLDSVNVNRAHINACRAAALAYAEAARTDPDAKHLYSMAGELRDIVERLIRVERPSTEVCYYEVRLVFDAGGRRNQPYDTYAAAEKCFDEPVNYPCYKEMWKMSAPSIAKLMDPTVCKAVRLKVGQIV